MQVEGTMRAEGVKAVIGVPLYNGLHHGHLHEAVDSLLRQRYPHVAFVFVDDSSSDKTLEVVASVAAGDKRIHLERNTRRLGLVGNWRRVFVRARELYPTARYFAWGSDHDRWHCRWLDLLAAELEAHPKAVMAYPRFVRINDRSEEISHSWPRSPRKSFVTPSSEKVGAGSLVYGLYRSEMLERVGIYPLVYRPDVYLLIELSLYGELRMVPETLWYRRERSAVGGSGTTSSSTRAGTAGRLWERVGRALGIGPVSRQHRYIFPGRVPLYSRLPTRLQHGSLLLWRLAVLGRGRPYVGRRAGSRYAAQLFLARRSTGLGAKEKSQRRQDDPFTVSRL